MTPPPFEPSDALVEALARDYGEVCEGGGGPCDDTAPCVQCREWARHLLRALGPAIGEEIIRQRVAKLSPDGGCVRDLNLLISITRTGDGTIATAGLTAHDLLRALGVAP